MLMKKTFIIVVIVFLYHSSLLGQSNDNAFIKNFADSVGTNLLIAYREGCVGCRDNRINFCDCEQDRQLTIIYKIEDRLYLTIYECCVTKGTQLIDFSNSWNFFEKNKDRLLKNGKNVSSKRHRGKLTIRNHYGYRDILMLIDGEYISCHFSGVTKDYEKHKKRLERRLANSFSEEY